MGLTNASVFIAAIAISVIVGVLLDPPAPASKKELLRALERTAASVDVGRPTIVLGVNVNLDLVVDALPVLKAAGIEPPAEAADVEQISSSAELAGAFAHFFGQGAAGERFVEDDQLFKRLVTAALTFQQAEARTGGNAALMANRMAQLGVRAVLSGGVRCACSRGADALLTAHDTGWATSEGGAGVWGGGARSRCGLAPRRSSACAHVAAHRDAVESDEVHLILEFKEVRVAAQCGQRTCSSGSASADAHCRWRAGRVVGAVHHQPSESLHCEQRPLQRGHDGFGVLLHGCA